MDSTLPAHPDHVTRKTQPAGLKAHCHADPPVLRRHHCGVCSYAGAKLRRKDSAPGPIPDRFDPKSFLNATALMCAIALPLQVSPSSTPHKQSTPCAPAASATSTRFAAASMPGRSTTTHRPNPCSISSAHMASCKRHQPEGVFRAKNAFYPAQMAFLIPKMPFDRCHLPDAFRRGPRPAAL